MSGPEAAIVNEGCACVPNVGRSDLSVEARRCAGPDSFASPGTRSCRLRCPPRFGTSKIAFVDPNSRRWIPHPAFGQLCRSRCLGCFRCRINRAAHPGASLPIVLTPFKSCDKLPDVSIGASALWLCQRWHSARQDSDAAKSAWLEGSTCHADDSGKKATVL